ncbi:MAG TPA: CbtB-domain containing protein [Chloroflexota bacterium]|nr:CbtB-domain containing protein [Chloroflexota bacterium]
MVNAAPLARPVSVPTPAAIPVREWLPWAVFAGVLMLMLLYIVGLEQGATALAGGTAVHEWVHDGRHLLSFPCH